MDEIRLEQTSFACPEQYDAIIGDTLSGRLVGYLRLRHGTFRVYYPDLGGEIVYEAETIGDGAFTDEERPIHLAKALEAIRRSLHK